MTATPWAPAGAVLSENKKVQLPQVQFVGKDVKMPVVV